jgi:hypothetical protein
VSWLSEEELDDLFRRHDKDKSGDIDAQVYSKYSCYVSGVLLLCYIPRY